MSAKTTRKTIKNFLICVLSKFSISYFRKKQQDKNKIFKSKTKILQAVNVVSFHNFRLTRKSTKFTTLTRKKSIKLNYLHS